MFKINENYLKLPGSYLFSTVGRKEREYKKRSSRQKGNQIKYRRRNTADCAYNY